MQVYGKVHYLDRKERLLSLVVNGNMQYYHLTNKYMKDFKTYLYKLPFVCFEASEEYGMHANIKCREIEYFIKIFLPTKHRNNIYYDLSEIKKEVKDLLNQEHNRLFLDLEWSFAGPKRGVSEIIQYGMVLEDKDGKVILEDSSFVKPMHNTIINKATLRFLDIDEEAFDDACSYIEFYQLMEKIIKEYDPKILAWGRNDWISIEKSFTLNHLHPLDIRNRYMNLMQIIKNYYNYKNEMGLFVTYSQMANVEMDKQSHDALEDAQVEREIFHMFKKILNS